MTGLEIIRAPGTTVEQIADIVAEHCPPVTPEHCDKLSRRKMGRPTSRRPRTRKGCTPTSSRCTPKHTAELSLRFALTQLVAQTLLLTLLLGKTLSDRHLRLEMPTQEC